jgi:DNA repair exonuclease SbcCD ATPase subunit
VLTTLSGAQDWSSCQHDLDRVKRIAQDASDAAEELESLENELRDKKTELQNCFSEPRIYDIYRDRCQSQRAEYEDARQDFSHKKARLQDELNALESRLRSIQLSCGYNFTFGAGVPRQSQQQSESSTFCSLLQSYKSKLTSANLLSICTKSMSEEDCRKCLK